MIYWLYKSFEEFFQSWGIYLLAWPSVRAVGAILTSVLIVLLAGPRVIRWLVRKKLGDRPEFNVASLNERMQSKANTPTMGGILISGAIGISVLLWGDLRNTFIRMGLFCLVWLGLLGGVDDYLKLTHRPEDKRSRDGLQTWEKLIFQIGLATLLGFFVYKYVGDVVPAHSLFLPFYKHPLALPLWAFVVITVLVITATSNAVNLTDGLDGLAAGCVGICSVAFLVLTYIAGSEVWTGLLSLPYVPTSNELMVLCGAITGATLGFLWYNCHPAQVFMGDTGSLPLGGMLGFVAIVIRQELMLFFIGGVFVFEAISVIIQVIYFQRTGKRFFLVAPIHHHFHMKGWAENQVVVRFWIIAAACVALALAMLRMR